MNCIIRTSSSVVETKKFPRRQSNPRKKKTILCSFFFCFFRKQSTEATGIEAQPMTRGLMCVYSLLVLIFFGFFFRDRKLRRRPPWPEGNRRPQCVWWKRTRRRRTELGRHFRGAARRKLDAGVDTFHPRDTTHEFTRPNKKTKKKQKKQHAPSLGFLVMLRFFFHQTISFIIRTWSYHR